MPRRGSEDRAGTVMVANRTREMQPSGMTCTTGEWFRTCQPGLGARCWNGSRVPLANQPRAKQAYGSFETDALSCLAGSGKANRMHRHKDNVHQTKPDGSFESKALSCRTGSGKTNRIHRHQD